MGDLDLVQIPDQKGKWARRIVVERLVEAGNPPVNWGGRTYEEQKHLWELYNTWRNGKRVGNAADNPDADTRQPHVRGMAVDLAVWDSATVKRMEAAGFVRPIWKSKGFSQDEPWHFELKQYVNTIKSVPKVPAAAARGAKPFTPTVVIPEEALMAKATIIVERSDPQKAKGIFDPEKGKIVRELNGAPEGAVWRGVESRQSREDLQVVFVPVSDEHYAKLKK